MKTIFKLSFLLACVGLIIFGRTASGVVYDFTQSSPPGPGTNALIDGGYDTNLVTGYWTSMNTDIPQGASGTGVFDSFLLVQQTLFEQGYNTSANNVFNNTGAATDDLLFANIPDVTGGNVEFFLDVNQTGTIGNPNSLLSILDVQIFLTLQPGQSTQSLTGGGLLQPAGTLIYSLDTYNLAGAKLTDNTVNSYTRSGSGRPELGLSIPRSVFLDRINDLMWNIDNVYLIMYMRAGLQLGVSPNYITNDGFEEWNVRAAIPEPSTALPLAAVLFAAILSRRHFRKRSTRQLAETC